MALELMTLSIPWGHFILRPLCGDSTRRILRLIHTEAHGEEKQKPLANRKFLVFSAKCYVCKRMTMYIIWCFKANNIIDLPTVIMAEAFRCQKLKGV